MHQVVKNVFLPLPKKCTSSMKAAYFCDAPTVVKEKLILCIFAVWLTLLFFLFGVVAMSNCGIIGLGVD